MHWPYRRHLNRRKTAVWQCSGAQACAWSEVRDSERPSSTSASAFRGHTHTHTYTHTHSNHNSYWYKMLETHLPSNMGPLQTPKRKLSMQLLLNFVIYSPVLNYEHTTNKKIKIKIKYLVAETFLTNVIFIFSHRNRYNIFYNVNQWSSSSVYPVSTQGLSYNPVKQLLYFTLQNNSKDNQLKIFRYKCQNFFSFFKNRVFIMLQSITGYTPVLTNGHRSVHAAIVRGGTAHRHAGQPASTRRVTAQHRQARRGRHMNYVRNCQYAST